MCPDSSASRTVRKVLETWDHKLSSTRSSFKKRSTGLKAICKVGGNFCQNYLSFLFYTSRWWTGMVFFGLCFLYCSRLSGLWTLPIPGWTPPIQSWPNAHPMKRIKLTCIYLTLLPTLVLSKSPPIQLIRLMDE